MITRILKAVALTSGVLVVATLVAFALSGCNATTSTETKDLAKFQHDEDVRRSTESYKAYLEAAESLKGIKSDAQREAENEQR